MTTVTEVKRALQEAAKSLSATENPSLQRMLASLANSPVAATILANRLSDRGEAGNDAVRRNLGDLNRIAADLRFEATRVGRPGCRVRLEAADKLAALEWAIEQLTPPGKA